MRHSPLDMLSGGVFHFWRWLTCVHEHHRWMIVATQELDSDEVHAAKHCPRCGEVCILE